MGIEAALLVLDTIISALCAWIALNLRNIAIEASQLIIMMFISCAVALIPQVGFVASLIVFLCLLIAWTETSVQEALWVVLVAKIIYLAILAFADLRWNIDWAAVLA